MYDGNWLSVYVEIFEFGLMVKIYVIEVEYELFVEMDVFFE